MSLSTTSRPSRMLPMVASNNELTAKLSGDWLRSCTGFDLFVSLRRLKKVNAAANSTSTLNTMRREYDGTTSARMVRTTQTPTRRACLLETSENTDQNQTLSVVGTTDEAITDANHCLDAIAAFIEFLAQAANMNVQRARVAIITVAPHAIQQLLARDDAIGAPGEHGK